MRDEEKALLLVAGVVALVYVVTNVGVGAHGGKPGDDPDRLPPLGNPNRLPTKDPGQTREEPVIDVVLDPDNRTP